MPAMDRSPVVPRLVVQMRANDVRGVPNTQRTLREALGISQPRVSEVLHIAISRGLVAGSDRLYDGGRCYVLTPEGDRYAAEQMQGAGP